MTRRSPALLLPIALAVTLLAPADAPRPASEPGARGMPGDAFFAQRAWPGDAIDPKRVDEAFAALAALRADTPAEFASIAWRPAGPTNIGGRVTAIAAHAGSSVVWLGAADGGVWRSWDGGAHWACVTDRVPIASVGALAMDPSNASVIWAGTGEANGSVDSYDGNGLWVTRDAGAHWQSTGLAATRRIAAIAVSPADPGRVYVAAMGSLFGTGPDRGLYRTKDGGVSWQRVLFVNDSTGACDVVVNPAHHDTVWCATWERVRRATYRRTYGPGCGIWRSTDGGDTWTRLANGLPAPSDDVGRIALAVSPSRPRTIVAQVGGGPALGHRGLGFFGSTDGGDTWTRRDVASTFADAFGGFSWYFGEVAVDPTNPDRVWALGVDAMRSTDGGATWVNASGAVHADQHALWIDPSNPARVLLGNDGGFSWSFGGGASWNRAADLPITQFYAGSVAVNDANRLLGGTQDNSSVLGTGAPAGWTSTLGGDGFYALADPVTPGVLFAEWQFGCDRTGLRRSPDGGASWAPTSGFASTDRFNWCAPFVMNPADHAELLMGSQRVWRSTDNGLHWSAVSGDLTRALPGSLVYSTITTLAISPLDPRLWLAGTDDGRVWRTSDRGATWVEIGVALPRRWVTRVVADPTDARRVWVTLSGFAQNEPLAHVWTSADLGTTWTRASGNLPDLPVNDLVVDPASPATVIAATDGGVMLSRNRGQTWFDLGTGLPAGAVVDLDLHAASRTLVAFTHGRSAWTLPMPSPTAGAPGAEDPADGLALTSARPDPSRGDVRLSMTLARAATVDVAVFDAGGRRVATLASGARDAGVHALRWDGRSARGDRVRAGVYWLRASAGEARASVRIVRAE